MTHEVLVIIPARSGSKGLRGKNMRKVGNETLLGRVIHLAQQSARREDAWTVHVSTNSAAYARHARRCGADVPALRPNNLARDTTSLARVVAHVLEQHVNRHGDPDAVLLLLPTAPLLRPHDVRRVLSTFWRGDRSACVGVYRDPVANSWRFDARGRRLVASRGQRPGRRQESPEAWVLAPGPYVASPAWLRTHARFAVPGLTRFVELPRWRCLDIESADDLAVARLLAGRRPEL